MLERFRVVGVNRWEELVGKPVRAYASNEEVKKLGNYLKDDWFQFSDLIKEYK
jgi:hypothetical protein